MRENTNEIIMLRKIQSNEFHENSMIYIYLLYFSILTLHVFSLVIFANCATRYGERCFSHHRIYNFGASLSSLFDAHWTAVVEREVLLTFLCCSHRACYLKCNFEETSFYIGVYCFMYPSHLISIH